MAKKSSTRLEQITKDLEALRLNRLACGDWYPAWAAREIEKDEVAGKYRWPEPKKK